LHNPMKQINKFFRVFNSRQHNVMHSQRDRLYWGQEAEGSDPRDNNTTEQP
jgi:hypothetical protein